MKDKNQRIPLVLVATYAKATPSFSNLRFVYREVFSVGFCAMLHEYFETKSRCMHKHFSSLENLMKQPCSKNYNFKEKSDLSNPVEHACWQSVPHTSLHVLDCLWMTLQ